MHGRKDHLREPPPLRANLLLPVAASHNLEQPVPAGEHVTVVLQECGGRCSPRDSCAARRIWAERALQFARGLDGMVANSSKFAATTLLRTNQRLYGTVDVEGALGGGASAKLATELIMEHPLQDYAPPSSSFAVVFPVPGNYTLRVIVHKWGCDRPLDSYGCQCDCPELHKALGGSKCTEQLQEAVRLHVVAAAPSPRPPPRPCSLSDQRWGWWLRRGSGMGHDETWQQPPWCPPGSTAFGGWRSSGAQGWQHAAPAPRFRLRSNNPVCLLGDSNTIRLRDTLKKRAARFMGIPRAGGHPSGEMVFDPTCQLAHPPGASLRAVDSPKPPLAVTGVPRPHLSRAATTCAKAPGAVIFINVGIHLQLDNTTQAARTYAALVDLFSKHVKSYRCVIAWSTLDASSWNRLTKYGRGAEWGMNSWRISARNEQLRAAFSRPDLRMSYVDVFPAALALQESDHVPGDAVHFIRLSPRAAKEGRHGGTEVTPLYVTVGDMLIEEANRCLAGGPPH